MSIITNLEKEIKIISSDFNETKNTVSNLIDNFTEVENNIKDLNKCLIKGLICLFLLRF